MNNKIKKLFPLIFLILFLIGCESKDEKYCKEQLKKYSIYEIFGAEVADQEMKKCLKRRKYEN